MNKKRNPVYVSENGKFIVVTKSPAKGALLFATSKKNLSALNRHKRVRLQEETREMIERLEIATAR